MTSDSVARMTSDIIAQPDRQSDDQRLCRSDGQRYHRSTGQRIYSETLRNNLASQARPPVVAVCVRDPSRAAIAVAGHSSITVGGHG